MDEIDAVHGDVLKAAEELGDREANFEQVAEQLRLEHGLDAQIWQSGGGIQVICIALNGLGRMNVTVDFGTAADMWGGTVEQDDEYTGEEVWTSVSSLETNPEFVAGGIADAMEKFF